MCSSGDDRTSWSRSSRRAANSGRTSTVAVHHLEVGEIAVDGHRGVDRLAVHDHTDELELDLAVREEVLAPFVEEHAIGGAGDLHTLRDEPGEPELGRLVRLRVEVAS